MTQFADRIRRSFEDLKVNAGSKLPSDFAVEEPALRGHSWDSIAELPRHSYNSVELDAVYAAVVRGYQRGPHAFWAPVLLEMLAPALVEKLDTLFSDIPEADADDIEQQLIFEVLRWASGLKTPDDLRFVDGTILRRAARRTSRWLRRNRRRHPDALDAHPELEYGYRRAELDELRDLGGGDVSREDLVLVYQFDVWHEPLPRLAREVGRSEQSVFMRIWRARQRLRRRLQSGGRAKRTAA
jgi:hypothetical protein